MSGALVSVATIEDQHALNRERWAELEGDSFLASLDYRIETNRFGQIVMMPPPGFAHSSRQGRILKWVDDLMKDCPGESLPESPLSTSGGVKGVDVIWISNERLETALVGNLLVKAPEICIEVLSPSNTVEEMDEKRRLYFEAGAEEVWICGLEGQMAFFIKDAPGEAKGSSGICPGFPSAVE